jgi:branched-chain amino acid transport system permease protein
MASLGGILYVWWSGQIAPGNVDLPETVNLLVMAVIGGLARIEGAWIGAFAFIVMQNYITDATKVPLLGFGGTIFGGKFPTLVGIVFLVIVLVSPGGLMGAWDRAFELRGQWRRWRPVRPQPTSPSA